MRVTNFLRRWFLALFTLVLLSAPLLTWGEQNSGGSNGGQNSGQNSTGNNGGQNSGGGSDSTDSSGGQNSGGNSSGGGGPPDYYDIRINKLTETAVQRLMTRANHGANSAASYLSIAALSFYPIIDGSGALVYPAFSSDNVITFDIAARSKAGANRAVVHLALQGILNCTTSSNSGICLAASGLGRFLDTTDPDYPAQDQDANGRVANGTAPDVTVTLAPGTFKSVGRFVLRNASTSSRTLDNDDVRVTLTNPDDIADAGKEKRLDGDVNFSAEPPYKCEKLILSGVQGNNNTRSCTSPCSGTLTSLRKGNITVSVDVRNPRGGTVPADFIDRVTYDVVGGAVSPPPDGIVTSWSNPPIDPVQDTLIANVRLVNGRTVSCGGPVTQLGLTALQMTVGTNASCRLHELGLTYYVQKKRPGQNGYIPLRHLEDTQGNRGVRYPGLFYVDTNGSPSTPAIFGADSATTPARGFNNLGEYINRAVNPHQIIPYVRDVTGVIKTPAAANRIWSGFVITWWPMTRAAGEPYVPLYYSVIRSTSALGGPVPLYKVPNAPDITDRNRRLVARAHLARAETVQSAGVWSDRRENDVMALSEFRPGDFPVMFMDKSCSDSMPISFPPIGNGDPQMPPELRDLKACIQSIDYPLGKVVDGYARLVVMATTPIRFNDIYPPSEIAASGRDACVSDNPTQKECWVAPEGDTVFTGTQSASGCHSVQQITHSANRPVRDRYGNVVGTQPYTWVENRDVYQGNCDYVQMDGVCDATTHIRFARFLTNMLSGLACVVAYDRSDNSTPTTPSHPHLKGYDLSGKLVAPVLYNQDVPPHSPNVGGQNPVLNYPAATNKQGYEVGALPCQFETDGSKGLAAYNPVTKATRDFPSKNYPNPINFKPEFRFFRSSGPADCVDKFTYDVEVRRFGGECSANMTQAQKELNLCKSENVNSSYLIPTFSKQYNDGGRQQTITGGDQVFASYRVALCKGMIGSGRISASISPLILDLAGKGIEISRTFDRAVLFDLAGEGKRLMMDWPESTNDVAFLALPDQSGKVSSMRQLFGNIEAKNGFEALKKHDKNKDTFIDAHDPIFSKLRLWLDRNRNGIAEPKEIEKLAKHGVSRIHLTYNKPLPPGTVAAQTLSGIYLNQKTSTFLNIEDHYFTLYYGQNANGAAPLNKRGKTKKTKG